MAFSNRAEHGFNRKTKRDGDYSEESALKNVKHSPNGIFTLKKHLTVVFLLVSIWSCAWSINRQDEFTITQKGIENLIETNMSLDEFAGKKIPYVKVKPPFQKPHSAFYDADEIGIQFEALD